MATKTINDYHTLVEMAKRTDPQGNSAELINILAESNPMLEEAHWEQANDLNSHEFTQVIELPSGDFGRINKGIAYSAGRTKQVVEPICEITDAYCVDDRLLKMAPSPQEYLAKEAALHVEGLGQTAHQTLLYGNRGTNPDAINGFMTRYNSLSQTDSVINGGGSGADLSSILVVNWGRDSAYLAYPREFGNFLTEKGPSDQWIQPTSGTGYWGKIITWSIRMGLCIANPKNVQRICNLENTGSSNIFSDDDLITALNKMDRTDNAVIYVNRSIYTQMQIAFKSRANVNFTMQEAWGRPIMHFMGIPIKKLDKMMTTETAVS